MIYPSAGLLAGFDAGQTHTTCRLARAEDGQVLASGEGSGVSHLASADGPARFQAALESSLAAARCALAAGARNLPLRAAAVGASGIEQGTAVQQQGQQLAVATLGLPEAAVLVTGDERTALRGAFPQAAGIVVISGTGTIAVGGDGRGRHHRCAGWGWLLDGAGSALDIGRDGLALSLQMADGRRRPGPLGPALWQALGQGWADPLAPQAIKALVVAPDFGAAGFARLAPVVHQQAAAGDPDAAAILERSAQALAVMVQGVAGALALDAPAVCGLGGGLTHLELLQAGFREALGRQLPGARLVPAAGDGCSGALALAQDLLAASASLG